MKSAAPHVAVWLDEPSPGEEVFAQALEWARRLGWPLRTLPLTDGPAERRSEDLGPDDLYVVDEGLTPSLRGALLRRVLRLPRAGVLLCPRVCAPIARVLVVVRDRDPASGFLDTAAGVCQSLGADPVVLTVAQSEAEARRREQFAGDRFAAHFLAGEFDAVVGGGLCESVAWVARLRRCALVMIERETPSWWRRLRGEMVERLVGLAATASVLALPRTWRMGGSSPKKGEEGGRGLSQVGVRDKMLDDSTPSRRLGVDSSKSGFKWMWWVLGGMLLFAGGFTAYCLAPLAQAASAGEPGHETEQTEERASVEVIQPSEGGVERTTTQPGSVQAYERARQYAPVSGILKAQMVDIGDRVTKGQLVAKIDVPDLEKQVKQYKAAVSQARARVKQMEARVATAKADLLAKKAKIKQAQAAIKTATAWRRFRKIQFDRMDYLVKNKSVEGRLQDEYYEHLNAAIETENTAKASLDTAKAEEAAAEAAIKQAEADVLEATAEIEVDQARVEKAEVMVQFSEIRAPYDGVVTQLRHDLGAYVRAASTSDGHLPLLTIERTDRFRVVVQVPDRDVPFCDPGDTAVVEIDALPRKKFPARVSRIAQSEDLQTRLMRAEIDLPNPNGEIKQGMYGRVTIILDRSAGQLSLPSSCLVGKTEDGNGTVYVVRDHHVHLVPVKISADNGIRIAVREGLSPKDQVVLHPSSTLAEGEEVTVTTPAASASQN